MLIQVEKKYVTLDNHVMTLDAELSSAASKLKVLVRGISEIRSERVKQHPVFLNYSQVCQGVSNIDYLAPVINV